MEINKDQIGKPILAADAIFAAMKKDKKGIFMGFYVNPEDITQQALSLNLGDVVRVFITIPELGA